MIDDGTNISIEQSLMATPVSHFTSDSPSIGRAKDRFIQKARERMTKEKKGSSSKLLTNVKDRSCPSKPNQPSPWYLSWLRKYSSRLKKRRSRSLRRKSQSSNSHEHRSATNRSLKNTKERKTRLIPKDNLHHLHRNYKLKNMTPLPMWRLKTWKHFVTSQHPNPENSNKPRKSWERTEMSDISEQSTDISTLKLK